MKKFNVPRGEFKNFRCSVCNCVSHAEISNELGEFNQKPFYPDPEGLGYLCHDCSSSVSEAIDDFEMEYDDEPDLEDLFDVEE